MLCNKSWIKYLTAKWLKRQQPIFDYTVLKLAIQKSWYINCKIDEIELSVKSAGARHRKEALLLQLISS